MWKSGSHSFSNTFFDIDTGKRSGVERKFFSRKFFRLNLDSWMDAFVEERRNFERRSRRFLVSRRSHYRSSFESEALDSDISHVFSSFFIL